MQKPRFMGCFWSLQGKKMPKWHFFKILGAKRNKLLRKHLFIQSRMRQLMLALSTKLTFVSR
jgi:hypothetical protein